MHTRLLWVTLLVAAALTFFANPVLADPAIDNIGNPAQAALRSLIAAPNSPLPSGTRLESVGIAGGLATADFSRELQDNFHGGDTDEANAVNGILRALGQYPTVDRVQILVAGRTIESLGGMLVISKPLAVIRPAGYTEAHKMYFHRRLPVRS